MGLSRQHSDGAEFVFITPEGKLWTLQFIMIEQSYSRYIRKDFVGPLIAARAEGLQDAAIGGKTGPLTGLALPPRSIPAIG